MGAKSLLRTRMPGTYRSLVVARSQRRRFANRRAETKATATLEASDVVIVDLSGAAGMGGILTHAGTVLNAGRLHDCRIHLRFTSPTYMPSSQPADWLTTYFTRLAPNDTSVPAHTEVVDGALLWRARYKPTTTAGGRLLWSHLAMRSEITEAAEAYLPEEPFAAVHFRGSDKHLESDRANEDEVIETARAVMGQRGLKRVLVASDEPRFIETAMNHLPGAFTLPMSAAATASGVPPHFTDAPGEVKAHEALGTMWALSKADVCVRTESYMTAIAHTLSGVELVHVGPVRVPVV